MKHLSALLAIVLLSAYVFVLLVTMPWFLIHTKSGLHWYPRYKRVGEYLVTLSGAHDV